MEVWWKRDVYPVLHPCCVIVWDDGWRMLFMNNYTEQQMNHQSTEAVGGSCIDAAREQAQFLHRELLHFIKVNLHFSVNGTDLNMYFIVV